MTDLEAARHAAIIDAYGTGLTVREVGAAFGISGQRVHQILRKNGLQCRPRLPMTALVAAHTFHARARRLARKPAQTLPNIK